MDEIMEKSCKEAAVYRKAHADGMLVENMHDLPWLTSDKLGPETTACMAAICKEIRRECPSMPIGIQVLTAGNKEALAIAKATGLDFVRVEGFVYSHIGDEGPINSCAAELLRYRKFIDAEHIQVFTDIKKKHSSHAITADVDVVETAKSAEMFHSDGIIITGTATGEPIDVDELAAVQKAVALPVMVGREVTWVGQQRGDVLTSGIAFSSFHHRHNTFFSGQVPISSDIHVARTFPDMSGARLSCRSWPIAHFGHFRSHLATCTW